MLQQDIKNEKDAAEKVDYVLKILQEIKNSDRFEEQLKELTSDQSLNDALQIIMSVYFLNKSLREVRSSGDLAKIFKAFTSNAILKEALKIFIKDLVSYLRMFKSGAY